MNYISITTDDALLETITLWETKSRIAVDFEGEYNLHYYGEHLCLIQIFDGDKYYIIDPISKGITKEGLVAFFHSKVKKVWFDCKSDNALIKKNYGVTIENIYDIRVLAIILGFDQNLTFLIHHFLGIEPPTTSKKKLQQANWRLRPINEAQLSYALSDVEYLFQLEDILIKEVEKAGKIKLVPHQIKDAMRVKKEKEGWTKLLNTRSLTPLQIEYLKRYYYVRDRIAKRFDVPAVQVLDKRKIAALARSTASTKEEIISIASPIPERFKRILIEELLIEAAKIDRE